MYPPPDYIARVSIPDHAMAGYRTGDGMYADAVEFYGCVLGVDIDAARPDVLERPAKNASREAWVDYVLTQEPGLAREELDDLGRNDLITRVAPTEPAVVDESGQADLEPDD